MELEADTDWGDADASCESEKHIPPAAGPFARIVDVDAAIRARAAHHPLTCARRSPCQIFVNTPHSASDS
eukprot:1897512-Rhodomonas_salina.6